MQMEPRFQARKMMGEQIHNCIQACTTCHWVCLETVQHCLQMGGEHAEQAHIRLLLDCAEICQTSANYMMRGSELHGETCEVCATVCDRCAQDCERFDDDPTMQRCADACQICAQPCNEIASYFPHSHM